MTVLLEVYGDNSPAGILRIDQIDANIFENDHIARSNRPCYAAFLARYVGTDLIQWQVEENRTSFPRGKVMRLTKAGHHRLKQAQMKQDRSEQQISAYAAHYGAHSAAEEWGEHQEVVDALLNH